MLKILKPTKTKIDDQPIMPAKYKLEIVQNAILEHSKQLSKLVIDLNTLMRSPEIQKLAIWDNSLAQNREHLLKLPVFFKDLVQNILLYESMTHLSMAKICFVKFCEKIRNS